MTVNGQLIGSKKMQKDKLDTYFGTISVFYQPEDLGVTVSTAHIAVSDGGNNRSFTWASTAEIARDR